jgi:hypothetical protein
MRWESGRRSTNIEDRRGLGVRRGVQIGGGGVILALIAALLGAPPSVILELLGGGGATSAPVSAPRAASPAEEQRAEMVKVVLADTEDTWGALYGRRGERYEPPTLVLFTDEVESACGMAGAAVGPFYCPADRKVYLDLGFFVDLERRFGAPGDFAQAYVVAHEVGHHVQTLLGVSRRVHAERARLPEAEANALTVRQELQADCFAGVWGHHANKGGGNIQLEAGDLEEALRAASAIGDDTLQRRGRGRVVPETFTHGSAEQRVRWFRVGFESGDPQRCDTFATARL